MKNLANVSKRIALAASALMIAGTSVGYAQATKKVLLEEYTGAWCGYCPDGALTLLDILEQNPENVIGVAIHQGDGMQLPTITEMSKLITGYPAGTVDRKRFSGKTTVGIDRGEWTSRVNTQLQTSTPVEVAIEDLSFNQATGKATFKVKANFLGAATGDLRFNVYVVEDSVSGKGALYDQVNYYSKEERAAGGASHYYYNYPYHITGYAHRHVVRQMLDGAWGTGGVIPNGVNAGQSFTKEYEVTIPQEYRARRVSLVAFVSTYKEVSNPNAAGAREVLNATETKLSALPEVEVDLALPGVNFSLPGGSSVTKTLTITNKTNTATRVRLSVDDEASTIPGSWSVSFASETVEVPASGSTTVDVTINSNGAVGAGELVVRSRTDVDGMLNTSDEASAVFVSTDAKYAVFSNLGTYSDVYIQALKSSSRWGDSSVVIPFTKEALQAFGAQFKAVVVPMNRDLGNENVLDGGLGSGVNTVYSVPLTREGVELDPLATIKAMMSAGTHVFLVNSNALTYAFAELPESLADLQTDALRNWFTNTLKISSDNQVARYTTNGQSYSLLSFRAAGFDTDSVGMKFSDGFAATPTNARYNMVTDVINVESGSPVSKSMYYDDDKALVGGVTYKAPNGAKLVFTTFGIETSPAVANRFMNSVMEYFFGAGGAEPSRTLETNYSSGNFQTRGIGGNYDTTLVITATGNQPLSITNIAFVGDEAFTVLNMPSSFPVSIPAGSSLTLNVRFSPTAAQEYTSILTISSNASNGESTTVLFEGTGSISSGVEVSENSNDVLSIVVEPNPVVNDARVRVNVNGTKAQNLEFSLVDARGAVVARFGAENMNPGSSIKQLDLSGIASGNYRLVARNGAAAVQTSLIIAR